MAANKKKIRIKPGHRGLLHEDLGVSPTRKLSEALLEKAAHSGDPAERKRAVFAENAREWNKK